MSMTVQRLSIDQIKIEDRFRKDLANLTTLIESIKQVGLLQPLVVNSEYRLIAGARRLAAIRSLCWTDVPVTICASADDALLALLAERDENTCRMPLAPSEAVALGMAIEAFEKPKAAERQRTGAPRAPSGNLPEGIEPGRARDLAAMATGLSPRSYAKAKAVVQAANEDPALAHLVEKMDSTGKIDPSHRELVKLRDKDAEESATGPEAVAIETIFCPRCCRIGKPVQDCGMCERLQEKAKKRKPKKPKYHAEGPVLDAFKNEVPKHLWDVWLDPWLQKTYDSLCLFSEEFRREDMIEGMRKRAKFLPFMMDRDFKDGCGMIIHTLDQLIEHIKQTRPAGVCPACNGEKCGQCLMSGLVPRGLYEQIKAKAAQDSDGEIAGIETLDDLDQSVSQAG